MKVTLIALLACAALAAAAGTALAQSADGAAQRTIACGIDQAMALRQSNAELERCAANGDSAAQAQLGMLYWGASIARDCTGRTCVTGDPESFGLDKALTIEELQLEGRRLLEAAAAGGIAEAQNELGLAYLQGDFGISSDPAMARTYLTAASENGDAYAAYNLARIYFAGYGVPVSLERAETYLRLAASRGYQDAQCSLARWLQRLPGSEARDQRSILNSCSPAQFMREMPLIDTADTL